MNWGNGLLGMVYGGLVLRPPWEFRVLVGLIVFFVLRSAFKWIVRKSGEEEKHGSELGEDQQE